jgi:hypothetical protein
MSPGRPPTLTRHPETDAKRQRRIEAARRKRVTALRPTAASRVDIDRRLEEIADLHMAAARESR